MNRTIQRNDLLLMVGFIAVVLAAPIWTTPIGANYPDLLQKFAIYGIFAIGFNICSASPDISPSATPLSSASAPT
jgi:hypothetical protein